MFTETIFSIDHEIEWINYELTRQSTNETQDADLKNRREQLRKIRSLCQEYQQQFEPQKLTQPQREG